jgi:endonuclease V-like protein UPF0215 family
MVFNSRFYKEVRVIMLHENLAGRFLIRDLLRFHYMCELPIMIFFKAGKKGQYEVLQVDDPISCIKQRGFLIQSIGLRQEEVKAILGVSWTSGSLPEPLRVARLVASALNSTKS